MFIEIFTQYDRLGRVECFNVAATGSLSGVRTEEPELRTTGTTLPVSRLAAQRAETWHIISHHTPGQETSGLQHFYIRTRHDSVQKYFEYQCVDHLEKEIRMSGPDPGVYKFSKKVKVNYKKINDNKTNPHLTFSQRNALWLSDYEKSVLKEKCNLHTVRHENTSYMFVF